MCDDDPGDDVVCLQENKKIGDQMAISIKRLIIKEVRNTVRNPVMKAWIEEGV